MIARVDILQVILFDLLFIGFTSGRSKRKLELMRSEWREDIRISCCDFVSYLLEPCYFTILYGVVTCYASSETKCPCLDHLVTIWKTVQGQPVSSLRRSSHERLPLNSQVSVSDSLSALSTAGFLVLVSRCVVVSC